MKVLVTGGAGFIGSVTVRDLLRYGYEVVVYDNLSKGQKSSLPENIAFVHGELSDKEKIKETLLRHKVDSVIHFAANIEAGESVHKPSKYFENNVINTLILLDAMLEVNVKNIVFSSSAAVYGTPNVVPIDETAELKPTSPYGETKLLMEYLLQEFVDKYGFRAVALRYFNAAGAISGCGEDHEPETHIIPKFIKFGLEGNDITIFGDGSHRRDYVHISDLAKGHVLSLIWLKKQEVVISKGLFEAFNLGAGKMYSNLEMTEKILELIHVKTGNKPSSKIIHLPDRPGDPQDLLASNEKAKKYLGWAPNKIKIEDILSDALDWHLEHPGGHGDERVNLQNKTDLELCNQIISVLKQSNSVSNNFKSKLMSWLLKNEIHTVRLIDYKSMSDEEIIDLVENGFREKKSLYDLLKNELDKDNSSI